VQVQGADVAVGIIEEFEGSDLEFYDAVCREIDFPADWPEGLIYHAAGAVPGGIRIVEQWQEAEQYERYVEAKIGPAIAALLGEEAQRAAPQVTLFPIHSVQTAT
jgi:hypothetical protein